MLEEETTTELVLSLQYGFSFPFDRLYELRDLIGLLEVHGVDRQQVHISGIGSETGKSVRVLESGRNSKG